MTVRTGTLEEEAVTQGAATGTSYLDGLAGHGTLQVVRGRKLEVMELTGTWRPTDESTDVSALVRAADEGRVIRFEGVIDDPDAPQREEVVADVEISSHATYRFGARLPDDEEGPMFHVFNFRPTSPAKVVPDAA